LRGLLRLDLISYLMHRNWYGYGLLIVLLNLMLMLDFVD